MFLQAYVLQYAYASLVVITGFWDRRLIYCGDFLVVLFLIYFTFAGVEFERSERDPFPAEWSGDEESELARWRSHSYGVDYVGRTGKSNNYIFCIS